MAKKIALVVWEDAFGCPAGWQHEDELETGTSVVHSVGMVLHKSKKKITLAPHLGGVNRETKQAAGVITIPRRQIISFSYLLPASKQKQQDV